MASTMETMANTETKAFMQMSAAEIAGEIWDCAGENLTEHWGGQRDTFGYLNPTLDYYCGCGCEDNKLTLGSDLTLLVSAEYNAADECTKLSVEFYDAADDETEDRYYAYRDAIAFELRRMAGSKARIEF